MNGPKPFLEKLPDAMKKPLNRKKTGQFNRPDEIDQASGCFDSFRQLGYFQV